MAVNPRIKEVLSQLGPAGYVAGVGRGFGVRDVDPSQS